MNVEKIRIVKNGKRYKRVVIPDGWERCAESVAEMVTWGTRERWDSWSEIRIRDAWIVCRNSIFIRRKAQP